MRLSFFIFVLIFQTCQAQQKDENGVYQIGKRGNGGTGKYYMGRELAAVMGHFGAEWLDRPERAKQEGVEKVISNIREFLAAKNIAIADIGAGSGYYTFRLSKLFPEGKVFAVDIQPEMLSFIENKKEKEKINNVIPVLGSETDPQLPVDSLDMILMVDVYHEFSYPKEMLEAMFRALKKGGKLIQLEFRAEDPEVPIKDLHKMTEKQVKKELNAAGFRFVASKKNLPWQHFLVFEK